MTEFRVEREMSKQTARFSSPVNIKDANESVWLPGNFERRVDPADDAVKHVGVDLLGQSVAGVHRPPLWLWLDQRLGHQDDPAVAQPVGQALGANPQELAEDLQVRVVALGDIALPVRLDYTINRTTKMKTTEGSQRQMTFRLQSRRFPHCPGAGWQPTL